MVDLRRNGKSAGTLSLRLQVSDPMANAELALRNVIRDVHSKYEPTVKTVDDVDKLAESGKRQLLTDMSNTFKNVMPVIDSVISGMDMVSAVCFLKSLLARVLCLVSHRPILTST